MKRRDAPGGELECTSHLGIDTRAGGRTRGTVELEARGCQRTSLEAQRRIDDRRIAARAHVLDDRARRLVRRPRQPGLAGAALVPRARIVIGRGRAQIDPGAQCSRHRDRPYHRSSRAPAVARATSATVRQVARVRRHELSHIVVRACAASLVLVACSSPPADDEDPPSKDKEPTGVSELGTSSTTDGPMPPPGDACDDAVAIPGRTWRGTLDAATADLAGGGVLTLDEACATGGPDVFVRRRIAQRADVTITAQGSGFVPRIVVLDGTCSNDLTCATGLPARLLDVAAGSELVIAVAIADADVATVAVPIEATLAIAEREVLAAGAACPPTADVDGGRCEAGTACIVDELGAATCTAIAGDTCASALEIAVGAPLVQTIDPATLYSDAHAHSCAGDRRREVVLHATWDGSAGSLEVSTAAPGVALAARAPACTPDAERACEAASATGARIVVPPNASGVASAYVFVELPAEAGDPAPGEPSELGPFDVAMELVAAGERG